MTRIFPSLAVIFVLSLTAARGQETPEAELDFIRKLRARGQNELAAEYIDRLKTTADPKLAQLLTLEQGRTLAAMARGKEPEQRAGLLASARTLLEQFIQKNPAGPDNALGRLELARLASYEGEALLSKALREDEGKLQQELAKKAEQQFLRAGGELEAAVKALQGDEQLAARFDRAVNYIDTARTFLTTDNLELNRRRGELVTEAKKIFEKIAADDKGEMGALAQAWLVKCYQEIQQPTDAKKSYDKLMANTAKAAESAQRSARLFHMQGILSDPTQKADLKAKLKTVEDEARLWLKLYPAYERTQEGWAVQYELAMSLYKQGQVAMGKEKVPPKAALVLFDQAQKRFATIAESNSDLSEKANQKSIQLSVARLGEKTAVADLKDFEDCYLKAQVEMLKIRDVSADMEKADEKERAELKKKILDHHATAQKALARAILLADAKTAPAKVDEVRYYLAVGYLQASDLYRAAVACEALGRAQPPSKRSALAAGYAIETYDNLLQRDPADEGARVQMRGLVDYVLSPEMQKLWSADPVTAVARYRLALMYNRDNDYRKAIEQLEKLPRDFTGYVYAQGELVFIAQKARMNSKDPDEKKQFQKLAQAALARMNPLPADVDPATARMYFFAQLEQSGFLYADAAQEINANELAKAVKTYAEMNRFLDDLKARYVKFPPERLSKDARERFDIGWNGMKDYARLGLIELDYRSGQYDKVLASTADKEALANKLKGDGKTPIKLKDYRLVSDYLVLALRAKVQKGKIAEANDLINVIERLSGEDGSEFERVDLPQILIGDMKNQVESLKKSGDKEKLKAVVANFSAFVDQLSKKLDQKALKPTDLVFFAQAYNSLEEYAKAAELYARIPEPKSLGKDKFDQDEEREISQYWYLQLQRAKALRMLARLKTDPEKTKLHTQAKKVLDDLLKHKNGRQQLLAECENVHILEDRELYGSAMKGWEGIRKSLAPQLAKVPASEEEGKRHKVAKELYFDAYYQIGWCLFHYSQSKGVVAAKKDQEYLTKAAAHVYNLEHSKNPEGWQLVGAKFIELMQSEPKLRKAYESLKTKG